MTIKRQGQVLINGVIGEVGTGTKSFGFPAYQELSRVRS
jgi:hypothetical protein